MPLIYAFVARGPVVLAEYTGFSGNFSAVALECLQNLKHPESKFTITCDDHTFNFKIDDGYTFLAVADGAFGRTIPFAFLDRVRDEWKAKYSEKGRTAAALSLNRSFGPKIKAQMEFCTAHPDELNKVASVQRKVDDVKAVMVENIEKVIERGERIELLQDKTEDLRSNAELFQKQGKQLRRMFWWQLCKMKLVMAFVVLLAGLIIFLLICFSGGRDCTNRNKKT